MKRNFALALMFFFPTLVLVYFHVTTPLKNRGVNYDVYVDFPTITRDIKFGDIESALSQVQRTATGRLVIDASTEAALSKAEYRLLRGRDSVDFDDLRFLVQQSFVGQYGRDMADLFITYVGYKNEERGENITPEELVAEKSVFSTEKNLSIITRRENLQIQHFGHENAKKLYSAQNDMVRKIFLWRL